MKRKNRHYNRSRTTEKNFRQLARYFALDFTASMTSELTGVSLRSVNNIFLKIRCRLAETCGQTPPLPGTVGADEPYVGAQRARGKRGRGASGKTIVFGVPKRQGKAYTGTVPDCPKATLQAVIRGNIAPETVIHSDGWRGYDGPVDIGFDKHFRVHHGNNEFSRGEHHINGIESFWSYAKRRAARQV